jgi:hypothetical protein
MLTFSSLCRVLTLSNAIWQRTTFSERVFDVENWCLECLISVSRRR